MIINTNSHRKELSNWLLVNHTEAFLRPLKLQKFLFFYEAFQKLENGFGDFSYLRAYVNGPVFSDVYGDYYHRKELFISTVSSIEVTENVDEKYAKLAGFLVKILNEEELSLLTHELDIWKKHEKNVVNSYNLPMSPEDFSESDYALLQSLMDMYPIEMQEEVNIVSLGNKNFMIPKLEFDKLNDNHFNILSNLAEEELQNPVVLSLSEDGVLLID